ncbi:MAG: DUF2326 domain-containing protein [Candidatus Marinimicrobia bacterium]|nr:DUF2326 domain-containing protein [Candidatus Neomarinimicrobiota bacterium]
MRFKEGLNIVVAEKSEGATKDQTRNAAGKSSMIEIIHFLLGSNAPKTGFFANEVFNEENFELEFDLAGKCLLASRSAGDSPDRNKLFFAGDVPSFIEEKYKTQKANDTKYIPLKQWKEILGEEAFGLGSVHTKFGPTFRSLFAYFCRRERRGGFQDPFHQFEKQMDWDRNVMLAYLLGFDWRVLSEMERLRIEEQHLDKLKRELNGTGLVGQVIGKSSSLRSQLTLLESSLKQLEDDVNAFRVLPQYESIESEASTLANKISANANANTLDLRLITDLKKSMESEEPPSNDDLKRLYNSVGVQLPDVAVRKLESVSEFHNKVIENRRTHLSGDTIAAEQRIEKRKIESIDMESRRQELMGLLQTHGALDQYNEMQKEVSRVRSKVEVLKRQYEVAHKIETGSMDLDVKRAKLHQNLVNDFRARGERLDEAVLLYAGLSEKVSERSSVLEIEPTKRGLQFSISGGPDRSKGIREQQIFCFDMLLMILDAKRNNSLRVLIHDSHLFDAMDERQIANAIEASAKLCQKHGFQYIITMNSDRIPVDDFSNEFNVEKYIVEPRLTDKTETGGLFGFRF